MPTEIIKHWCKLCKKKTDHVYSPKLDVYLCVICLNFLKLVKTDGNKKGNV